MTSADPDLVRIATFNANGIRSAVRRGFGDWLERRDADVVAVQEMRCPADALPALPGVVTYEPGTLAGRNGVALITRTPPVAVRGFGRQAFDHEGRYVEADLELDGRLLTVVSVYVPKGGWSGEGADEAEARRYRHKTRFLQSLSRRLVEARSHARARGGDLLVMGDVNIAHTALDLRNVSGNRNQVGFLPQERAWLDAEIGPRRLVDVVRHLHPGEKGPYSWWRWGPGPFDADTGWRIDYHLATIGLARRAEWAGTDRDASYEQRMSDHAPVVVDYRWPRPPATALAGDGLTAPSPR